MSHSYTMQVTCDCLFVNVLVDIVLDIMFVSFSTYHACMRYILVLRWVLLRFGFFKVFPADACKECCGAPSRVLWGML